ncbi:MAG: glycolate oxidase iron-sulfur subunit [Actinomycetota bacterium]|nr:glycolate oxidase iron-sulfur subunit [Actinomycetota bacterium]
MPDGARFIGRLDGAVPGWTPGLEAPADVDLDTCVACGLCLPHCPTYRLSGEESMSPRGRIAAMRAVGDGAAPIDETFTDFMDRCLVCRACEDVCPSHVPFGRLMEAARVQIEPRRPAPTRAVRRFGLQGLLARKKLLWVAAAMQPLLRPLMPARVRSLTPRPSALFSRLPALAEPPGGVEVRGTVGLLRGCIQDRWFREVNLATIRVLTAGGWRVRTPRSQSCCGALPAHNGRVQTGRALAARNAGAFSDVDHVIVNAAGCAAHLSELPGGEKVREVTAFLVEEGLGGHITFAPLPGNEPFRVAYHDACHALRVLNIHDEPRSLLRMIPGLELAEIAGGDQCCGAAGIYNVTQPELSGALRRQKAEAVRDTGATAIASANPGCTLQLIAGLKELGASAEVIHPIQLLDRAMTTGR